MSASTRFPLDELPEPDYKLAMLAASHAHFVKAAEVLTPELEDLVENGEYAPVPTKRIEKGLELLEEAMELHEKYMEACK